MMLPTLLLAAAVAAPGWVKELNMKPPPAETLKVTGKKAPGGVVLIPAGKRTTLEVQGPATLTLRLYGITLKRVAQAGSVEIQVDDGRKRTVDTKPEPEGSWQVPAHPLFGVAPARSVKLNIGEGSHTVSITPSAALRFGLGVAAKRSTAKARDKGKRDDGDTPALADGDASEPALPPLPPLPGEKGKGKKSRGKKKKKGLGDLPPLPEEPALAGDSGTSDEPPLPELPPAIGPAKQPDGDSDAPGLVEESPPEPGLLSGSGAASPVLPQAGPNAAPADAVPDMVAGITERPPATKPKSPTDAFARAPGFSFVGNTPPEVLLFRPEGEPERFFHISPQQPLVVEAVGPGTAVFDIHAHRDQQVAATMEDIALELAVGETLPQMVIIDQPVDEGLRIDGKTFELSSRATLKIPVSDKPVRLRLSAGPAASLGLSVRPTFDPLHRVDAISLTEEPPATISLPAEKTPSKYNKSRAGGGVYAGAWFPTALPVPGNALLFEGTFAMPALDGLLEGGILTGLMWVSYEQNYADPRNATGSGSLVAEVFAVPVLLDLRWRLSVTGPLSIQLGLGTGVFVGSVETRALDARDAGPVSTQGALFGHLDAIVELGPGELVVRGLAASAQEFTEGPAVHVGPSGVLVNVGYRMSYDIDWQPLAPSEGSELPAAEIESDQAPEEISESSEPSDEPSAEESSEQSDEPSAEESSEPSDEPSAEESSEPPADAP